MPSLNLQNLCYFNANSISLFSKSWSLGKDRWHPGMSDVPAPCGHRLDLGYLWTFSFFLIRSARQTFFDIGKCFPHGPYLQLSTSEEDDDRLLYFGSSRKGTVSLAGVNLSGSIYESGELDDGMVQTKVFIPFRQLCFF